MHKEEPLMAKETVTIDDIARRADVSIATVSRALHDYDDVSPETKELVRKAAEEMGYTANKHVNFICDRFIATCYESFTKCPRNGTAVT